MGFWQFYWNWLKGSFYKPLRITVAIAGALAIAEAVVQHFYPQLDDKVEMLLWIVPLSVLGVAMVLGVLLAPYFVQRKLAAESDQALAG